MWQQNTAMMKNYLISVAIGDIAGSAYEGRSHRIKDYDKVKMFSSRAHFTDDTVLTFACAEAFIDNLDMTMNLWKCANEHRHAGFGSKFKIWMASHKPQPYRSLGNGCAMRCSSAGWLAKSEEECIKMATETAAPTHNHPEGIKGAVVTALTIFHLKNGKDKDFIREQMLADKVFIFAILQVEDSESCNYCSFDTFRMVMGGSSRLCSHLDAFFL